MNTEILKAIEKINLPFPWETNARGQVIMTPVSYDHGNRAMRLSRILARIAPQWECGCELGIITSDGLKSPDVTLASPEYHVRHVGIDGYVTEAPEICVEVMSPSNSWQEMREKIPLYFEVGALEVWIVDVDGTISFFAPNNQALAQSGLIPDVPHSI
jgi:Uma2 family endonuclease